MKMKLDASKILGIAVAVLSIAGTIVGSIKADQDRQMMKEDIKNDILGDLNKES